MAVTTRRSRRTADRRGQQERQRSHSGRTRLPNLRHEYGGRKPPVPAGDFEFRFTLYGRKDPVRLDNVLTEATWTDDSSTLSGSLTLQRPDPDRPTSLVVAKADRVKCEVRWGSSWRGLWVMRVQEAPVDPIGGTVAVTLLDDLVLLTRNRRDWTFRKTHRRKRGYYLHEVVRAVARREGLRLGVVAEGTKRMTFSKKNVGGLAVLREACSREKEASGVRFVIRLRGNVLDVIPYSRNRILYQLGEGKEEGVTLEEKGADRPVTVIEARGHVGKGRDAKKVEAKVFDRNIVRRFGRVVDEKNYGRVSSRADLMNKARRDLAKAVRVRRTGTVTHRGIPFIRRGDGVRWITDEPGWFGKAEHSRDRSFSYVTAATHSVSGSDYTMELTLTQEDPYHKDQERLDKERRKKARELRKRRQRGHHG